MRRLKGGRVQLLSNTLLPNGGEQALFLAYTMSAVEGVMGTCYANLNEPDSTQHLVQRMAIAERFDMSRGPEFHAYGRETTPAMLAGCDAWAKRREIKDLSQRGSCRLCRRRDLLDQGPVAATAAFPHPLCGAA